MNLKGDSKLKWLVASLVLVGVIEALSWFGFHFPPLFILPFFLVVIAFTGLQTIKEGFSALFSFNFKSINLLMLIAVIGALFLEKYAEAAIVIILYNLAEKLEDIGIVASQSALQELLEKIPKQVEVKGSERPVDPRDVLVGSIVIVRPGEIVPLDGVVVLGSTAVDESSITGEPLAKDKMCGDFVFAGTLNCQGYIEVKVVREASQSSLAKIKEMTLDALEKRGKTEKFIERFSSYYTPLIICLAVFWVFFSPYVLHKDFRESLLEALTLLVIACPCALVISTPISIYSAIGNAARNGILVKGGECLEGVALLKALAFDKTRTLTLGRPVVSDLIPLSGHSVESLLSCAAGIESQSEHPLAKGVVEAAKQENLTPHAVENFKIVIGKGAEADCLVCDEKEHWIGKLDYIMERHTLSEEVLNQVHALQSEGKSVILVSNKKEIEGLIALKDKIWPEAFDVIQEIKKADIQPLILTGDGLQSAKAVASALGITHIKAEQLPEDKKQTIDSLIKQFKYVGMIGDGINDGPALAAATVGITTSELGSDTAIEAASIVMLNDHLKKLPFLIHLSRKTLSTIKVNTFAAISIKALFIALSLLGLSGLPMAIFADVGMTLLVMMNSLRLRLVPYKPRG